jgi:hypothetical protein
MEVSILDVNTFYMVSACILVAWKGLVSSDAVFLHKAHSVSVSVIGAYDIKLTTCRDQTAQL